MAIPSSCDITPEWDEDGSSGSAAADGGSSEEPGPPGELVVEHTPNPSAFEPGGPSGSAYTCAYATTVTALTQRVYIDEFYAGDQDPWDRSAFIDWYGCEGGAIEPGESCTDPNNWTGSSDGEAIWARWVFVGHDADFNEIVGEAIVDCDPFDEAG